MSQRLESLRYAGVSVWLDDLSRDALQSGALAEQIRDRAVTGVTTNPTIFARSIASGRAYEAELADLRRQRVSAAEALRLLMSQDVRAAADALDSIYQRTAAEDGWVSIEVDPALAWDPSATVAAARLLQWMVARPNVFVKIPATKASLPAVSACLAEGISVNVTLIFSPERYAEVLDAALVGMEGAIAQGRDVSALRSVASFFVSRLDTAADQQLSEAGCPPQHCLAGTAGMASALASYQIYCAQASAPRWRAVVDQGGAVQRPLWASTGIKNPSYRDTMYVEGLVTPGAVNTMPLATLESFHDHGVVGTAVTPANLDEAAERLRAVRGAGVDLSVIAEQLERDGVEAFNRAWHNLEASLAERLTHR